MRSLLGPFLAYFLTPAGLVVLSTLDASLIFFLPLGIDFVLILVAARHPDLFWAYPLLAAGGSLLGAAFTYWTGHTVGEKGLSRFVSSSRLKRVQQRVTDSAAPAIGALAIIPPPFPFTAFVLTSGALALDKWRFFATLAAARLLRFGVETALARRYGRRVIAWMDSPTFEIAVGAFAVLAVVGTIVSAVAVFRSARGTSQKRGGGRSIARAGSEHPR
ncbi:MAG TPA: VTT domain-containing protein [Vicinamibacterales bacterium]|nr:VTT domain-containing protein [Vicinamibacterales bacterium]